MNDNNSNLLIKLAYDIVMALIRSKMLLKGYIASGNGAHEAEVAYMQELGGSRKQVEFLDQLRYFRNGIMYYGKKFDSEYCNKVMEFTKKLVDMLD